MPRLSRRLTRAAIVSRDMEAVMGGPAAISRRVQNKMIGRMLGKLTRGLWRR